MNKRRRKKENKRKEMLYEVWAMICHIEREK